MYRIVLALLLALLLGPAAAQARSSSPRSTRNSTPRTTRSAPRTTRKCSSCARDSRGRIARSTIAKYEFQQQHPCPATGKTSDAWPGYVIDHVVRLKRGGLDEPGNMQWQMVAAAKAKDEVE